MDDWNDMTLGNGLYSLGSPKFDLSRPSPTFGFPPSNNLVEFDIPDVPLGSEFQLDGTTPGSSLLDFDASLGPDLLLNSSDSVGKRGRTANVPLSPGIRSHKRPAFSHDKRPVLIDDDEKFENASFHSTHSHSSDPSSARSPVASSPTASPLPSLFDNPPTTAYGTLPTDGLAQASDARPSFQPSRKDWTTVQIETGWVESTSEMVRNNINLLFTDPETTPPPATNPTAMLRERRRRQASTQPSALGNIPSAVELAHRRLELQREQQNLMKAPADVQATAEYKKQRRIIKQKLNQVSRHEIAHQYHELQTLLSVPATESKANVLVKAAEVIAEKKEKYKKLLESYDRKKQSLTIRRNSAIAARSDSRTGLPKFAEALSFNAASVPIVIVNLVQGQKMVNNAVLDYLGFQTRTEYAQQGYAIHPTQREYVFTTICNAVKNPGKAALTTKKVRHKRGYWLESEAVIWSVPNRKGKTCYLVCVYFPGASTDLLEHNKAAVQRTAKSNVFIEEAIDGGAEEEGIPCCSPDDEEMANKFKCLRNRAMEVAMTSSAS